MAIDLLMQALQALRFHLFLDLVVHIGARGARSRRVFEGKRAGIADVADQAKRGGKVIFGFAGEAHDEVGGERKIGPRGFEPGDHVHVVRPRMAAVHGSENAVGTRLNRQMQLRHQRREIAMCRDQVVGHVEGVARRVAQSLGARHLGDPREQARQRPAAPIRALAVIRVDVLPDERDLAHAGIGQALDLGDDFLNRPRNLGATRIGNDTEGAELVAALLHRDEGGDAAGACRRETWRRQRLELVLDPELDIDDLAGACGAREQDWQAVIILRSDDEVDGRRAADDFLAFGLRDAAGHRDQNMAALAGGGLLQAAHPAKLGIDLLRRLLTDVAGVENDEIGVLSRRGLDIAFRRQGVRHTLRIVDVHLAAEGFYVDFP